MADKKSITLVPVGGLANRMRAIASAVELSRICNCHLDIFWFRDKGLNCPFHELFCDINSENVTLYEETPVNKIIYDRPRKRNLWIPILAQELIFNECIYEDEVKEYCHNVSYFESSVNRGKLYIASCYPLIEYSDTVLSGLFTPSGNIKPVVASRISDMSEYRIGVHIRRTDNTVSIKNSPDELFYKAIDDEIRNNGSTTIYLATDSEEVKSSFKNKYGTRLFTSSQVVDRNSVSGISEAVSEMYILSMMNKIYGSWGSTYSEVAAALGGIPITILRKTTD